MFEATRRGTAAPKNVWRAAAIVVVLACCLAAPAFLHRISLQSEMASALRRCERSAAARAAFLPQKLEQELDALRSVRLLHDSSSFVTMEELDLFVTELMADRPALRAFGWLERDAQGLLRLAHLLARDGGQAPEPRSGALPERLQSLLRSLPPDEPAIAMFPERSRDPLFHRSMAAFQLLPARDEASPGRLLVCVLDLDGMASSLADQWGPRPMETHLFQLRPGSSPAWLFSVGGDGGPATVDAIRRASPLGYVHVGDFEVCGTELSVVSAPQEAFVHEHLTWQPAGILVGSVLLVASGLAYLWSLLRWNGRLRLKMGELLRTERKAALFLEAAPEAMVVTDRAARILMVNHQAELLFGWTKAEVAGLLACTLFQPSDGERRPCPLLEPGEAGSGPSATFQMQGSRKDGTRFPAAVSVRSIRLDDDEAVLCAAIRDETEAKEAEEALEMVARQLAVSNAELSQFASVASHDLQAPLRMVSGYLELIERRLGEGMDPEVREFLDHAMEGAGRMRALIDDLLEFSRIDSERDLRPVPVDTGKVLDKVVSNLRLMIEDQGAGLTWERLPLVIGDARKLEQLFTNLITNALKYRGELPARIEVGVRRQGSMWELAVKDNGIGIDPAYHERVFEMFERLHGYGKYKGTGLGLAICRKIVESTGGRIWVESREGQGATFRFTLPAAEGAAPAEGGTGGLTASGRPLKGAP